MHLHVCPHCVAQTVQLTAPFAVSYWMRLKLWWATRNHPRIHSTPEISR